MFRFGIQGWVSTLERKASIFLLPSHIYPGPPSGFGTARGWKMDSFVFCNHKEKLQSLPALIPLLALLRKLMKTISY